MSLETFKKIVDSELIGDIVTLHGMGEPLLNHDIVEMVSIVKNATTRLCTNGILFDESIGKELKDAGLSYLDVTNHNQEVTDRVNKICARLGLEGLVSDSFRSRRHNWAGAVDLPKPKFTSGCDYLDFSSVTVLWNGDVTTCCVDAFGKNVLGHIDNIKGLEVKPGGCCDSCHHQIWKTWNASPGVT